MPGTNPNAIPGWFASAAADANAVAGANGASVNSLNGYATAAPFAGLTLKTNAINGQKSLAFAPGRALVQPLAADPSPPPGITSGGAFPGGFSAVAVIKFNALTPLPDSLAGLPKRTFLGLSGSVRQPADGGLTSGWAVMSNGKLEGSPRQGSWSSYWGWDSPYGPGVVTTGSWVILGLRSDGETLTLWRGRNVERTATNPIFGSGFTQFIDGLTLGADPAVPGWFDFDGEIAYLGVYNRAISDSEYDNAFLYLADRFALPTRDIDVPAVVGVGGKWMFLPLKSAADGVQANLSAQTLFPASTFSYRVNGGSPQTPAQVVATVIGAYSDPRGVVAACPLIALRLNATATAGQTYTLSIAGNVIQTDRGYVDALTDGPVRNCIADGKILSWDLPPTVTMTQGWNFAASYYWTPKTDYINLIHAGSFTPDGQVNGPWTAQVDSDGFLINPRVGERILLRSTPGNVTPGSGLVRYEYPGIEAGRYVISWTGPDGPILELTPDLSDAGQTTVTHVPGLDVLTGPVKRRYYDVAEAPGSIRKRLTLGVLYTQSAHCRAIDVRHTKYEGVTSRKLSDQTIDILKNFNSIRFLDLIQVNASNIGRPEDFAPPTQGSWALTRTRTLPAITRIESWGGPYGADLTSIRHLKITFAAPHDVSDGQFINVVSTDGNPINVVLANGTVNLKDQGAWVFRASATELVFLLYSPGIGHSETVTAFTGTNAAATMYAEAIAPIEAQGWIVNDSGVPVCHTLLPHTLSDSAIATWATKLANTLLPGKKVYVELSNEPWNQGFPQYITFRYYTCVLTNNPNASEPMTGYTWRAVQFWDKFRAAWVAAGRDAADLTLYFGSWYNAPNYTQTIVDWVKANRPDITRFHVGVAPYAFPNCLSQVPGVDYGSFDRATVIDFAEADTLAVNHGYFLPAHKAILDASGLDATLKCYEAQQPGFGLSPRGAGTGNLEQWARADLEHFTVLYDPRCVGISMEYLKQMQAGGVDESTVYGHTGGNNWEIGATSTRTYGEYSGLTVAVSARGDGADGGPDNVVMLTDGSGNPKWPDSYPLAAPRAEPKQRWQAALVAGGTAVTATWGPVPPVVSAHPDPLSLAFNVAVTGVTVAGVSLTRDNVAVPLSGVTLTGSGTTYTLAGLSAVAATPGAYLLKFSKDAGVTTPSEDAMAADATRTWTIAAVVSAAFRESGVRREYAALPMGS